MTLISVIQLRKTLHQHPELSGAEGGTAKRIQGFIKKYQPTKIIDQIGGTGLAAVFEFGPGGKTIAIRCELDALPIPESNSFGHRSVNKGISHKCGHDGHMAIVAGLAPWLKDQNFSDGKVILLFQPAEETGEGARRVVEDPRFQQLKPEFVFALHNIPGEPLHQIISCAKGFSAEVQSFALTLEGKEAHAAEPEKGNNPALGMSEIVTALDALNELAPKQEDFAVLTPVYSRMGQKAYGISAGTGELHYTIRTWSSATMSTLQSRLSSIFQDVALKYNLKYQLDYFEHFPASRNNQEAIQLVNSAAKVNGYADSERPYPFKFGEDFGWYSKKYKTAMFGIGAGINCPALHQADYDFPEEIIPTGMAMFHTIITGLLRKK